jgi:uncharacterized membrane protein YraQ (UPF0718 family)
MVCSGERIVVEELIVDILLVAFQNGLASLAAYLAAHVLLCLVPAFFIAGALSALVPQQSIIRFLGPAAPKVGLLSGRSRRRQPARGVFMHHPAAVCRHLPQGRRPRAGDHLSCSSHRRPTSWRSPIPASPLGAEFAIARIVLALAFGIGIGMIMAVLFRDSSGQHAAQAANETFAGGDGISRRSLLFLGTLWRCCWRER